MKQVPVTIYILKPINSRSSPTFIIYSFLVFIRPKVQLVTLPRNCCILKAFLKTERFCFALNFDRVL